jgi:MerR family transcriptional regulator, redox-sensitive transcriptional activator SoxR
VTRGGTKRASLEHPTRADWEQLSRACRHRLDERIAELERLRDKLTACIGCGCLSLRRCQIYNPGDKAAEDGPGARFLLASDALSPEEGTKSRS